MAHEHPVPATDRASMLISCPANAPSWDPELPDAPGLAGEIAHRRDLALRHDAAYVADLHARFGSGVGEWVHTWAFLLTAEEEKSIWRRQSELSAAAAIAADYLDALPPDQAGGLRLDTAHGGIVVQVTRDAEGVRAELQSMVGDDVRVTMETVRFSQSELSLIAARIERLPGLRCHSLGAGGGNGRVDVMVPGDPDEARRLIEAVADPCSFAVTHGESFPLPAVGTANPALAATTPAVSAAAPDLTADQDR
jgi:hypothetical protein